MIFMILLLTVLTMFAFEFETLVSFLSCGLKNQKFMP